MRWWSASETSPSSSSSRRGRYAALIVAAFIVSTFAVFAWLRFDAVHNRTFDLAFYTRMAWGGVRADFWMPIVDAHILGLHLSPILLPLGLLGIVIGTVNALLLAQALSAFGAAVCLARLGHRRMGSLGAWLGVFALLLHPNLGHVLTYEVHPGTLALFPLAWAAERLEARDGRGVFFACIAMLLCREDLALIGLFAGGVLWRYDRRHALWCGAICAGWFAYFLFHLHPTFSPRGGSFSQHLGIWGETPAEVVLRWLDQPGQLLAHVFGGERGTYVLRVLLPWAFLPLVGWRLAIPAIPVLGMNLVSGFATTPNLDSHYLTPALPFLAAAALVGASKLARPRLTAPLLVATLSGMYLWAGFRGGEDFVHDEDTTNARAALAQVPAEASVQAPDALLPHLAERTRLHRASPPDHGDDYTIVDVSHRERYAGTPTLLRTVEEPHVRNWLQREDYGLIGAHGRYFVFAQGADPRDSEHLIEMLRPRRTWPPAVPLSTALRWTEAREDGDDLVLEFLVVAQNPGDLALRFSDGRVDLLCDGELGLTHLRAGDIIRSRHAGVGLEDLSIGLIRTSGAPPTHRDPRSVSLERLRLQQRAVELRTPVPEEAPPGASPP